MSNENRLSDLTSHPLVDIEAHGLRSSIRCVFVHRVPVSYSRFILPCPPGLCYIDGIIWHSWPQPRQLPIRVRGSSTGLSSSQGQKTHFLNSSFYRFLALGTIAMLKMGQFGVECDSPRRNWWDPVEMWNLAVIPRFGHSLMLLAAIPGQPNAYGALAFFRKIDRHWNIFDFLSKCWFFGSWIFDFWSKF